LPKDLVTSNIGGLYLGIKFLEALGGLLFFPTGKKQKVLNLGQGGIIRAPNLLNLEDYSY